MRKAFLIILVFLLLLNLYSQETELIKEFQKEISETKVDSFLIKSYYVLKSENSIKNGYYREFYQNGNLKVFGHFTNNKKDKEWIFSNEDGSVSEKGSFNNDEKIGVWETHNKKNGLIQKYDFTKNKKLIIIGTCPISYPCSAREKGIQGTVKIKATLDSNCKLENLEVLEGVGEGCDEEALRVIKKGFEIAEEYNANDGCTDRFEIFEVNFLLNK